MKEAGESMSVTAIFAEILIIGIQVCLWIYLLLASLGVTIKVLELKEQPALLVAALAVAYALGIVGDRVSDSFFSWLDKWFRRRKWHHGGARGSYQERRFAICGDKSEGVMRLRVLASGDGKAKFLEYQRSRLRIARATAFNLLLILVFGSFYVLKLRRAALPWTPLFAVALPVAIGAVWSAFRIDRSYWDRLCDAYVMWHEDRGTKPTSPQRESE